MLKPESNQESGFVMSIEKTLKEYKRIIISLPNVTDVGIERKDGNERILVFVTKKIPPSKLEAWAIIPKKIEVYATEVRTERRKTVRKGQDDREGINADPDSPAEVLSRMQLYFLCRNLTPTASVKE
jgi:hypothetical protein